MSPTIAATNADYAFNFSTQTTKLIGPPGELKSFSVPVFLVVKGGATAVTSYECNIKLVTDGTCSTGISISRSVDPAATTCADISNSTISVRSNSPLNLSPRIFPYRIGELLITATFPSAGNCSECTLVFQDNGQCNSDTFNNRVTPSGGTSLQPCLPSALRIQICGRVGDPNDNLTDVQIVRRASDEGNNFINGLSPNGNEAIGHVIVGLDTAAQRMNWNVEDQTLTLGRNSGLDDSLTRGNDINNFGFGVGSSQTSDGTFAVVFDPNGNVINETPDLPANGTAEFIAGSGMYAAGRFFPQGGQELGIIANVDQHTGINLQSIGLTNNIQAATQMGADVRVVGTNTTLGSPVPIPQTNGFVLDVDENWNVGTPTVLSNPDGASLRTRGTALSPDGQVAGGTRDLEPFGTAMSIWDADTGNWTQDIPHLPNGGGINTGEITAISNEGKTVAGFSNDEAFLWTQADGTRSAKDVFADEGAVGLDNISLLAITDMSENGDVLVGDARESNRRMGFVAQRPESEPTCVGDINGDGKVDYQDLALFAKDFGTTGNSDADFDGNSTVDFADFLALSRNWSRPCS